MSRWWLAGAFVAVLCLAWLGRAQAPAKEAWFIIHQARFDESVVKHKTPPMIPNGWKFVGVEHGDAANETHLWFQDEAGSMYLIKGFTPTGSDRFVLNEYVNQIEAEK